MNDISQSYFLSKKTIRQPLINFEFIYNKFQKQMSD